MRLFSQEMNNRGFTLLELLVASSIGAVVIFALYMSFSSVLAGRSSIEAEAGRSREAARFVDSFMREVSAAYLAPSNEATFFRGTIENGALPSSGLEFTAIVHPPSAGDTSGDISAIRYSVAKDGQGRQTLYKEVWNPYGAARARHKVDVLDEVSGFELGFFDGRAWSAAWDGRLEGKTPVAVRASVKITDKGVEKEVKTLVRVFVR